MFPNDVHGLRKIIALLRITLGIIILVTWVENLTKGTYSGGGISGLFELSVQPGKKLTHSFLVALLSQIEKTPCIGTSKSAHEITTRPSLPEVVSIPILTSSRGNE